MDLVCLLCAGQCCSSASMLVSCGVILVLFIIRSHHNLQAWRQKDSTDQHTADNPDPSYT